MRVVQCPSPDNGIELANQLLLGRCFAVLDNSAHFIQERLYILLRGLDKEFPIGISSNIESKEIEATANVGYNRLFRRKCQAAFGHKRFHQWFYLTLQKLSAFASNDKIICITNQIHFGIHINSVLVVLAEPFVQHEFQTVQNHIGNRRRNASALWRSRLCRKQLSRIDRLPSTE